MPFEYTDYHNPYAASIGELLLHQGDVEATRARAIATANARAAEISGQAWAGAVQGVGTAVAGAAQQMADPRAQLDRLQLADAQRQNRSRNIFEAELKNPANYKPDGTVDDAAISNRLKQQDVGAWEHWTAISQANAKNALELREKYLNIQKTGGDIDAQKRTAQQAQADYLGKLAYHATDLLQQKPDDALHARDTVLASVARAAVDGAISEPDAKQFLMQTAHATPDQLRQVFASFVPPELAGKLDKEKADTAKANADAAKAAQEAQNLKDFGRTTPGTPEEQYLTAITRGDQGTADRILKTIRDTAAAKKDPAAASLANELANLRADEARARLEGLQKKNAPLDIAPDIRTTANGRQFVDLSLYQGDERNRARAAAGAAGAVAVSKEQADALQEIDNARSNQTAILTQITDILPKGPGGRVVAVPATKLEKLFQSNDQIAAFGSWRTAAINSLRATAGSKGLRINKSEIEQAVENDIPKLTDTLGTAQQKVHNIFTMLENAEKSILEKDRSVPEPTAPDLSGLASGQGRTFSSGPFSGQTWTVGLDGQPHKVN
jgi:hypothetical protein